MRDQTPPETNVDERPIYPEAVQSSILALKLAIPHLLISSADRNSFVTKSRVKLLLWIILTPAATPSQHFDNTSTYGSQTSTYR